MRIHKELPHNPEDIQDWLFQDPYLSLEVLKDMFTKLELFREQYPQTLEAYGALDLGQINTLMNLLGDLRAMCERMHQSLFQATTNEYIIREDQSIFHYSSDSETTQG